MGPRSNVAGDRRWRFSQEQETSIIAWVDGMHVCLHIEVELRHQSEEISLNARVLKLYW